MHLAIARCGRGLSTGVHGKGWMLVGFPSGVARETARKPSRGPRQSGFRAKSVAVRAFVAVRVAVYFAFVTQKTPETRAEKWVVAV